MDKLLITMVDGGLVNYTDDMWNYPGCPTCNYGSEYITEIDLMLTHHKIHVKINQMYEYALSEGDVMKLFLINNNKIQSMTESEFSNWFKAKLDEATNDKTYEYEVVNI